MELSVFGAGSFAHMPMSIQCQQWPCACTLLVCPCNYTISHYAFTLHAPHSQGRRHRHSSPNEPRSAADEWRAGHSRFETKKSHRVSSLRQKTQKAHREGPSSASRREDEVRGGVDDNKTDRNNDRKNVFESLFLSDALHRTSEHECDALRRTPEHESAAWCGVGVSW